jgi:hypothetical protein
MKTIVDRGWSPNLAGAFSGIVPILSVYILLIPLFICGIVFVNILIPIHAVWRRLRFRINRDYRNLSLRAKAFLI